MRAHAALAEDTMMIQADLRSPAKMEHGMYPVIYIAFFHFLGCFPVNYKCCVYYLVKCSRDKTANRRAYVEFSGCGLI